MLPMRFWRRFLPAVTASLLLLSCASQKPKEPSFTLFYPGPPDLPRLQWLTSFTTERDVVPELAGFERFIVGEDKSVARLDKPYGVAMHDGKIYVCDTNRTLMVFDLVRRTFERMPGAQGAGRLVQPVNIHIDAEGFKYVADPLRGQIVVFDAKDAYSRAFGTPGGWKPVDAAVRGNLLFVADMKGAAVVVLDKESGRLVRRIGREGDPVAKLYIPTNLALGSDDTLYVSDAGKFTVVKYGFDGSFRGTVGRLGTNPGTFARPKGIAVDRANQLYVVDSAFSNVQIFNPLGQLLMWFGHFGKTGRDPGDLFLPAKVTVDYDNVQYFASYADPGFQIEHLVLVTSQFGDRMVNVYGFGRARGKEYPSDVELKGRLEQRLRSSEPFPQAPSPGEAAPESQ